MDAVTNLRRKEKNKRKSIIKEPSESETWFMRMSDQEKDTLLCLGMNGMWIRSENTILMGSDAMDKYLSFKNEMIEKYEQKRADFQIDS